MLAITSAERRALRGRAHHLHPVVAIGQHGLTPSVLREIDVNLRAHELIKVRLEVEDAKERREAGRRLAEDTDAHLVGAVGKVAILYRARAEEPAIRLPA